MAVIMADLPLAQPKAAARPRDFLPLVTAAALLLGITYRLACGIDVPLWLDETFPAEIASQHNIADWLSWCLNELSGPVYYGTLFLWEKLAGNGNVALRLPSLIFSIVTPLLILWRGHPDKQVRMLWAGIVALCLHGFDSATEARPYALLFLLATGQAIIFLRLIAAPRLGVAFAWTTLSVLMVLTHYHAALICGLQGLAYLAICGRRAVATWPALLPLLPMAIWMYFHLPLIFSFASPDTVWYHVLDAGSLWLVPALVTGVAWPGALLLAVMAGSLALDGRAAVLRRAPWPYGMAETALVASGVIAFALIMGMGFVVPSFTPRYLLPVMPAVLAGVALWTRHMMRRVPIAGVAVLGLMVGSVGGQFIDHLAHPGDDYRYLYNFEGASRWIGEAGPIRLVFLWDSPTAAMSDPVRMAAVGSFALRRAGHDVQAVSPRWPKAGQDPNRLLLAMAGADKGTAILWAYDSHIAGTRGIAFPWAIPRIDPRWQCRDFGGGSATVLACIRR